MRAACRVMPDPTPLSMFDHLYATEHPVVDRDRAWLSTYLAGFADSGRGH
jgi:pyruvate dehydrogenase E1 component alpha subunit